MDPDEFARENARRMRRLGLIVTAIFWALQFGENTLVAYFEVGAAMTDSLAPRLCVLAVGVACSYAMVEITARLLSKPFHQRIAISALAATAAWLVVAGMNYLIFSKDSADAKVGELVYVAFTWSWFIYSFTGATLAIAYHVELRDRDRRLSELGAVAREAQLRALRYQLNPHFLFNTLNSVAALISAEHNATAERMVESLSDYLRSSLALDPLEDITLAEELGLQKLYLDIETVRFPDRMDFQFEIPDALLAVLVPSYITQPLVENAVRHAVARSTTKVTIHVSATEVGGMLMLRVADSGGSYRGPLLSGTGIGLRNVAGRLRGTFGSRGGGLHTEVSAEGGFVVTLTMPLRFAPSAKD